eukprot:scaffold1868_cov193-Cylindrotheca_fusiformis.AAC.10
MMGVQQAQAFIAFLNCEAQNNEQRAKNLRATALAIEGKIPDRPQKRKRDDDIKANKNPSGYSLFVEENIEQFKKSHPDRPAAEITSIMSKQWTATSEEEKRVWNFRAKQQMQSEKVSLQDTVDQDDETNDPANAERKRPALKKPPHPTQSVEI